jgi:Fe-S cluster assembly protein SufD
MTNLAFPQRSDEAWRYVDTALLEAHPRQAKACHWQGKLPCSRVPGAELLVISGHTIVTELSDWPSWKLALKVCSLETLTAEARNSVDASQASRSKDYFSAQLDEALVLQMLSGVKAPQKPLQIVTLHQGSGQVSKSRLEFFSSQQAEVELICCSAGDGSDYCANVEWSFHCAPASAIKVVARHADGPRSLYVGGVSARLLRDSRFRLQCLSAPAPLVRHRLQVDLVEENSEVQLSGVGVLEHGETLHHHVTVNHHAPHCRSQQVFKASLGGKSRSSFDGTIEVDRGANGTDAQQINRFLMLSDEARASAKPQLKIYADDVSCAHGATTGQLEKEERFYLASRGLSAAVAEALLARGFIEDVLNESPIPAVAQQWREEVFYPRFKLDS